MSHAVGRALLTHAPLVVRRSFPRVSDEIATRKEAERRLEAADLEYQRYRQEKKKAEQAHQQERR
jgi:hypothetical protein